MIPPATGISVVIPTYNRLPLLQETLASVYSQSVPADEVIVVDDGSTDGTREWLEFRSSGGPASAAVPAEPGSKRRAQCRSSSCTGRLACLPGQR